MKKLLLVTALSLASLTAFAQSNIPSVLKAPIAQGLKVHKSFDGPSGLTGWVLLKSPTEPIIVFTTSDGKTLMSGAVLDETGRNLVEGYLDAHAPKADYTPFIADLAKATAIVQGDPKAKNIIYAFFDPTCPYCNLAYTSFKTALKPGSQVRWIPVAFLSTKSAGQAAALLTAADPVQAMEQHEATFKAGGIAQAEMTPEAKKKLDENLKMFRDMGFKGVPAIMYRTADGRWDAVKGAPGPAELSKVLTGK